MFETWSAIKGLLSNLWSAIDFSPLWSWVPNDLALAFSAFLLVLIILAIKRAFLS